MKAVPLVTGLFTLLLSTLAPSADDFSGWAKSRNITINTTSGGAAVPGNVRGFPLLVRLDKQAFDFSQARRDGGDIRFSKSDGTTALSYHIERWDSAAGLADVWVRVDTVYGNNSSQSFKMYWGKPFVTTTASGAGVYRVSGDFEGAWHLNETGTGTRFSQTGRPWNGLTVNYDGDEKAEGIAGRSDNLDATNDKIIVGDIDITTGISISAWVNPVSFPHWGRILDKAYAPCASPWSIYTLHLDAEIAGRVKMGVAIGTNGYSVRSTTSISPGQWSHVAGTWDGDTLRIFVNGTLESKMAAVGTMPTNDINVNIGSNSCYESQRFHGKLDEIQLSKAARSPEWMKLSYQTQKPGSKVVDVGEAMSAWNHSETLTLNTTATGAGILGSVTQFPLLVRLTGADFDFSQARAGGADVRFSKPGGELLPYHIERWDSAGSTAAVWVKLDTVHGDNATQSIRMHWGNSLVASESSGPSVFTAGNGYRGVWHLNEGGTGTRFDKGPEARHGTPLNFEGDEGRVGIIAGADSLDASNDRIDLGDLDLASAATLSAWVNMSTFPAHGRIIGKAYPGCGYPWTLYGLLLDGTNNGKVLMTIATGATAYYAVSTALLPVKQWAHVVGTYDGANIRIYIDGVLDKTTAVTGLIGTGATPTWIGSNSCVSSQRMHGKVDEVTISGKARSADWIKLAYQTQKMGSPVVVRENATPPLQLAITSPAADTTVGQTPFPVQYTVNGTSRVRQVALVEGLNLVIIDSVNALGVRAADTVRITLFTPAPVVQILSPAADTLVNSASIPVAFTVDGVAMESTFALVEGANTLVVEAFNAAGRRGADTVMATRDSQAPVVVITRPVNGAYLRSSPTSVEYSVDGLPSYLIQDLNEGLNHIVVSDTDEAGNRSSASVQVTLDSMAPVVSILSPGQDTLVSSTPIQIGFSVDEAIRSRTINLMEGLNEVMIDTTDAAGNTGADKVYIRLDSQGPNLTIVSPLHGAILEDLFLPIRVLHSDTGIGTELETFAAYIDGDTITSLFSSTPDSATSRVSLGVGNHTLVIMLADRKGNVRAARSDFELRLPVPAMVITSPADFSTVHTADVVLQGRLNRPVTQLQIAGVPATVNGNDFEVLVPLHDGRNTLVATAFESSGIQGAATITLTLDREKPRIYLTSPRAEGATMDSVVIVTGAVSDRIADANGQTMPEVTVNGFTAEVVNFTFKAAVPLSVGNNTITAVAMDRAGNSESSILTVRRLTSQRPGLRLDSGTDQVSPIYSSLLQPLSAKYLDASGNPLAGKEVLFQVAQGDGTFPTGKRTFLDTTDAEGKVTAGFVVGKRAGPGANRVVATAVGEVGEVVFTTRAMPRPATRIHTVTGDLQRGIAGIQASQALSVLVVDTGSNPVSGVSATFRVVEGGGHFDGAREYTMVSGEDGRAYASFTLGPREGRDNNIVRADFSGNTGLPATFVLSGYVPGPIADTKVSGIILDNSNRPIPGVTIRIEGSAQQAVSDSMGRFSILQAPVGVLHLLVDGSTATRPGDWVTLMFEVHSISGKDNDIGMPIYLVARNNNEGQVASASEDRVILLGDMPGFSLMVRAGSATFPADMDDHTITVTQVHTDKIPMPPGEGMQPRMIISIGPPQVKFDPPALITFPNVDGLKPGEQTHFYSFDHDLGAFVSIGTGTVSEDGATVASDRGFGIVKGGWHCGGPPNATGQCEPPTVKITQGSNQTVCLDQKASFRAEGSPNPGTMTWGGGGTPAGGQGAAFETAFSTAGPKQISATWRTNKNATATAQVPIMVVENFGIPPEASSIAYLGPLPLTPNSAPGGITRVGFPDLNFETYLDCATQSWRIKVTQAVSETFMGVSMGTRQELTPFTILSTFSCSELEIMESDFYEGSHCCPSSSEKYYMESAIRAHEELHMSNMKTILADSYRIFLGRVASIAEPISGYQTKEAALLGMTGGSDFGAALLGLVQDYNTSTQHEASHGDAQTFTDAERRVLYPNLRLIQERKSTLNCP